MSSQKEAAEAAVRAGVDIDMMSPAYMFHLEVTWLKKGSIPNFVDRQKCMECAGDEESAWLV